MNEHPTPKSIYSKYVDKKIGTKQALKLFESDPGKFNLVLTDMTMPAMTGLELSKKLTEIRSDIPIVLCTGFSTGITTETIRDAGIREMIKKPMIASELAEAVEKALNHGTK